MVIKDLLEWRQRVRAPVKDITSLHGQLSFVGCIVKPGCTLLWRIVEEMQWRQTMETQIQLSEEFSSELDWWIWLLPEWNGVSIIPEFQWVSNANFDLFTDASGTMHQAPASGTSVCDACAQKQN